MFANTNTLTGATQRGWLCQVVANENATAFSGLEVYAATKATAFTLTTGVGVKILDGSLGAGSTMTQQIGVDIAALTIGGTSNFGIRSLVASSATGARNLSITGTAVNVLNGNTRIGSTTDPTNTLDVTGNVAATTSILSSGATQGVGYATGAGGTVTQATSRTTGVTLNKVCGAITTNSTSLAGGATAKFTVTNSAVAATDVVVLSIKSATTTDQTDVKVQGTVAGSFDIVVANRHLTTAEVGAIIISFSVSKAVTA